MSKKELIKKLKTIKIKYNRNQSFYDGELAHVEADDLLLEYINNKEVTKAYEDIEK